VSQGAFVGVDVGGTKVAAAPVVDGHLGEAVREPSDVSDGARLVEQIAAQVERVRTDATQAVGVGVPSVVDFATGRIRASANVPLADLPLRSLLSDRFGVPVFVDNDASCAALAEAYDDGALKTPDLVLFTIGTGVGGGLVLNGRLYRGATGAAAELGHTVIGLTLEDGAPPPEGRAPLGGSFERLAAGRALDRLASAAAERAPGSALGRTLAADGEVTGEDVVRHARDGDEEAADLLRILGERLGIGIANAINTFDPMEVVVGGGVSSAGELLLAPARRVAEAYTLPGVGTETQIRLARHGVHAGLLGAGLLAGQEHALEAAG